MTRVAVTDLTKDFTIRKGIGRQAFRAVDRVSFDLLPGRTVALVGESGSGKSTIARMLAKLEKPTSGRIDVELDDGTPVVGSLYRRHVQMVFRWSTTSPGRSSSTSAPAAGSRPTSGCSRCSSA
jgi:ABC-type oligopeptide transport system ATPase subunit